MDQNRLSQVTLTLSRWLNKFNTLSKTTQGTLLLCLLAGVIVLLSYITKDQPVNPDGSFFNIMVSVSLKLLIVLLLIYLAAFFFQKFDIGSLRKTQKNMQIIETLALTPRRALYLIKVGNQSILIGATDQSVTLIKEIDDMLEKSELESFSEDKNNINQVSAQIFRTDLSQ